MIEGYFDRHGRPHLQGRLIIERLQVDGPVEFLVDTGSDGTVLHPKDGQLLRCRFDPLKCPSSVRGIGGTQSYFREPGAVLVLEGTDGSYQFPEFTIDIAKPNKDMERLPSLLGNDILKYLDMSYRRGARRLTLSLDDK